MRKIKKYIFSLCVCSMMMAMTACGDDEKLVMVTTEKSTQEVDDSKVTEVIATDAVVTEETTVEISTEEASDQDKQITIEQICQANMGDNLLANGNSYQLERRYIGNDSYTETWFLGFDKDGSFVQAYENSDSYVQVLLNRNRFQYVSSDEPTYALIFSEYNTMGTAIDYQYNNMLFSGMGINDDSLEINNVYRRDGKLIVEMKEEKESDAYTYEYTLSDDYKVEKCVCKSKDNNAIFEDVVTSGGVYNIPAEIDALYKSTDVRVVTIKYPKVENLEYVYYIPKILQVKIQMEEKIYSDEAMTTVWDGEKPDDLGQYSDLTVYIDEE